MSNHIREIDDETLIGIAALRSARRSLINFTRLTFPKYVPGGHHLKIADALERAARTPDSRLLIATAPRHGKSELGSRRFPAWYLGLFPDREIIAASYNAELALDFGRKVKNTIQSPEYAAIFPKTVMHPSSHANDRFNTTADGAYVAVGMGGSVTGRGAHFLLLDDLIRGRKDADSETKRKDAWDWYREVAYTRLAPGGSIAMIGTRWHEDDVEGRAIADDGENWEKLILPAVDQDGQALWPDRFDLRALARIRRVIGERSWNCLYQQNPTPDDGTYFSNEWLIPYVEAPSTLKVYGGSDYAVTSEGGDYTVHIVIGVDVSGQLWLLDMWRGQTSSHLWVEAFCDMVARWGPLEWAEESGQILSAMGPYISRRLSERRLYVKRRQFASRVDKEVRAQSIRARMALSGLRVPSGKTWTGDFTSELMKFPAGKHDDMVDSLGLVGQLLDHMYPPHIDIISDEVRYPVYGDSESQMIRVQSSIAAAKRRITRTGLYG